MSNTRYSIYPCRDKKTDVIRYAFRDEKPQLENEQHIGVHLYTFDNGISLIIENAADAITVCSLLNRIKSTSTK
jgi:hypothetical protein